MFFGLLSVCAIGCFCVSLASNYKEPMKCVSLKNQPCKSRRSIVNINSDKALFYPLTVVLISVVEIVKLLLIHILEFLFQVK